MALMVLVNTAGDGSHVYGPLRHAEWNGWTPTDVVFPSFLWIVGVAMTLSLAKRLQSGASRAHLLTQVFRRAAILYALGLLIYAFPRFDLSTLRLLGVLQRIAICYLITAAIYLNTGLRAQVFWIVSLLAGYWIIMTLIPVPGYGPGNLDVERNFAHYIDSIVLGRHNYAATRTWDPEGIVSTLPAIATTLFGVIAGQILRSKRVLSERTTWLFIAGNALIAIGLFCNLWLPINKKLWTSSFSVFMAGLDSVIFAMFVWAADELGYRKVFRPFAIMGMNAIAVYMASELLDEIFGSIRWGRGATAVSLREWLYRSLFAPLASPIDASLLYAIAYTALMFLIAWGMYRGKWFLRV